MRVIKSLTILLVLALMAGLLGCDLLKKKNDAPAGSASVTSGVANTGGTSNTGTGATPAETNDPSKGATSGCVWPDNDITKDTTLTKGCTAVAKNAINIREGATLTIEEGVKVSFETDAYLWVDYGKVIIKGTQASPVLFTSANKSPAAGDWVGLGFQEKTMAGTTLDHLIIEFAGSKGSSGVGAIHLQNMRQGSRISMTNSIVRTSAQFGLVADENATFAKFENNNFSDNKLGSVNVVAEVLGSVGRGNTFSQPIHVKASRVDQTTTWPPFDVPVFIDGNVEVYGDTTAPVLTIADKTTLRFGQGMHLDIGTGLGGSLVVANATLTSAAPSPSPGDWGTIFIHAKSSGTRIEGNTIEYFGSSDGAARGAITIWATSAKELSGVTITNNTFRKGKQAAMHGDDNDCSPFAKSNKVEGIPFCTPK